MRIGVISDTHGMLRPTVEGAFQGVDQIIHCGDVGEPNIIDRLAVIAPVAVAYGNTDGFDVRSRSTRVVRLECEGRTIIALHGDQLGMPTPIILKDEFPDADIILYGHTHKPLVERVDVGVVVMNPGAAGAVRCSCQPSVGLIELDGVAEPFAQIVSLNSAG